MGDEEVAGLWWLLGTSVRKVDSFALVSSISRSCGFHNGKDARAFLVFLSTMHK